MLPVTWVRLLGFTVAVLVTFGAASAALAFSAQDTQSPSYSGCTTSQWAGAYVSGANEGIEADNWDLNSCASNVAAKRMWYKNGATVETSWVIHPTYAWGGTLVFGGYVYSWGRAQIERTSGNWSGFFNTNLLFP